jgi:hypothetical protein
MVELVASLEKGEAIGHLSHAHMMSFCLSLHYV